MQLDEVGRMKEDRYQVNDNNLRATHNSVMLSA
jgi:hypothetical protein